MTQKINEKSSYELVIETRDSSVLGQFCLATWQVLGQKEAKKKKLRERERENYHTIQPFNSWVYTQKLHRVICTSMFIALLSMTAKKWNQLTCLAIMSD